MRTLFHPLIGKKARTIKTSTQAIQAPSLDTHELEQFQKLAEDWWDPTGPFWPLHTLNTLRMQWINEQLQAHCQQAQPLANKAVLDIGCGGGILSESLALAGAQVTGLDVSDKSLAVARKHAKDSGLAIEYQHSTAESIANTGTKFDIVFNMEVVEHVADVNSFMQACSQCVKPGGVMFVATINRNWLAWLIAIVGAEYVLRWLPKGTHRYAKLRTPKEISQHLARGGLSPRNITGVQINPLSKTMHLSRLTAVNYMIFAA